MGSGLLRCQRGPTSCCCISGALSGLKAPPRGDFREPTVSMACLFCQRRPWQTRCRSQVRLLWATPCCPPKSMTPPGWPASWNIRGASLPSAGFLQVLTGSRSSGDLWEGAAPAASAPWPHLGLDSSAVQTALRGADCKRALTPSPWSRWQKCGHSGSGFSSLSPGACTRSPPHSHPTLQMRKLRFSQARGLTEDHPLVSGGAVT